MSGEHDLKSLALEHKEIFRKPGHKIGIHKSESHCSGKQMGLAKTRELEGLVVIKWPNWEEA